MSNKVILHRNYTLQEKTLDLSKESLEGGGIKKYEVSPDEGCLLNKVIVRQEDINLLGISRDENQDLVKLPVGKTLMQTVAMYAQPDLANKVYYYYEPAYDELNCYPENLNDVVGYMASVPFWMFRYVINPHFITIGARYIKCNNGIWSNVVSGTSNIESIDFDSLEKVEYKFCLIDNLQMTNCTNYSFRHLKTVINGFYSNMNDTALITGYNNKSTSKFLMDFLDLPALETFEIRQGSGQRNALVGYLSNFSELYLSENYNGEETTATLKLITNSLYKGCYLVYNCPDLKRITMCLPLTEMGDRSKNHYLYLCDSTCINLIDLYLRGGVACDLSLDKWNPTNALDNSKNDMSNDERMSNKGQFIQNFIYDILRKYTDLTERSDGLTYKIYVCDAVYQALFDDTTDVIDFVSDGVFPSVSDAINEILAQKGLEIINVG